MPIFFTFFISTTLCHTTTAQAMRTPKLILAIQSESMALFTQLVRGGTDVNVVNAIGRTAAHYAVEKNNLRALQMLLDKGADVNVADKHGKTLLDLWQTHEDKEMLVLLQEAGAQPTSTEPPAEEQPPATETSTEPDDVSTEPDNAGKAQDLWQAAESNDVAAAKRLLAEGADAQAKNADGKVPFDVAVEAGHDALAAILLRAAAGIDGKDEKSWTPLHWAIVADDWDLVRELLAEGADIRVREGRNHAWDVAKRMKSEAKLLEALVAEREATPLLTLAIYRGDMNTVKYLVEHGVDLNAQNEYGSTALIWRARWSSKMDMIRLLVDLGADIDAQDEHGYTALMWAAYWWRMDVVKYLVEQGADVNIRNTRGLRAFTLANQSMYNKHQGINNILLKAQEKQAVP